MNSLKQRCILHSADWKKKAVLNPIGGMKTVGQEGDTIVLQKKEKRNMMII